MRLIGSLTAATAAAATLAVTAPPTQANLPPVARTLLSAGERLPPKVELRLATRTIRIATSRLRFLDHHPSAGRRRIRLRIARDARWLLAVGSRARDRARARLHPPPPWTPQWLAEAVCIHEREGAWNDNTGNGYWGGMQFLPSTWRSVGGTTPAYLVSPREQLYRAYLVWDRDAGKPHDGVGSWREWGTAGACGLN